MHVQHAVVWVDHREARIFLLDRKGFKRATVSTELRHHQTHNKAGTIEGKRTSPDQSYYQEIVTALEPAAEWLIFGPGSARDELASYVRSHDLQLSERVIGVESADHPTDREIVARARTFFKAADRMLPSGSLQQTV
jgi:stalled ribosome rescue protein Dom34